MEFRSIREGRGEVLNFGCDATGGCRGQVDSNDVEANGDLGSCVLGETLAEDASEGAQDPLLVLVHGELGGNDVAAGAGFDFDETEAGTVPGNEVDIARETRCLPAAGNDGVVTISQVEESFLFTVETGEQVCRGLAGAAEFCG